MYYDTIFFVLGFVSYVFGYTGDGGHVFFFDSSAHITYIFLTVLFDCSDTIRTHKIYIYRQVHL